MIRRVEAAVIRPLRREILRPTRPPDASVYDQDDNPQTVHLAAYDDSGALVGCVTVFPEPYDDDADAWRLRGMATVAEVRGSGVGAALLQAAIDAAIAAGAPLLWCNAREAAEGFYAKYGFVGVGELFDLPVIGLHRRMHLGLRPSA